MFYFWFLQKTTRTFIARGHHFDESDPPFFKSIRTHSPDVDPGQLFNTPLRDHQSNPMNLLPRTCCVFFLIKD